MCASTLCPFSSSTRNMALGNGSTTVPSTRIVSSLGLARTSHLLCVGGAEKGRKSFSEPTDHAIWSAPERAIGHFTPAAGGERWRSVADVERIATFWAVTPGG